MMKERRTILFFPPDFFFPTPVLKSDFFQVKAHFGQKEEFFPNIGLYPEGICSLVHKLAHLAEWANQ